MSVTTRSSPRYLTRHDTVEKRERWILTPPDAFLDVSKWPPTNRWLLDEPARADALRSELREAARQGTVGAAWDWIAKNRPWGFDTHDLATETSIWSGSAEEDVPLSNFDYLA